MYFLCHEIPIASTIILYNLAGRLFVQPKVEGAVLKSRVCEGVAESDVIDLLALHHNVSLTNRIRLGVSS